MYVLLAYWEKRERGFSRCIVGRQDSELTQNHSGRKAASRNSRGRCGGPPCPERHGCQSGVSRPSLISPRRLPVVAVEPKRRRWRGRAGDRGKHDSHRPFTNRKAAPGEGTVIRARVGRPIPFRARSAQGPVHFPPAWRVMMRSCLLYTSPSPRDKRQSRMPSSA